MALYADDAGPLTTPQDLSGGEDRSDSDIRGDVTCAEGL